MILQELPDCKLYHARLTMGKNYEIVSKFGTNGVIIEVDDGSERIVILASRFVEE